jgi:DNA replication protein DnaC
MEAQEHGLLALMPSEKRPFYEQALQRRLNDKRTEAERRRDLYNRGRDYMDPEEFNCRKCDNRGATAEIVQKFGYDYIIYPECECMEIRRAIRRMKNSGLERFVRGHTFETFRCDEPWQQAIRDRARAYVDEGLEAGRWFYAGGQPGSGKTHICTAIAREALYRYPLVYMMWETESKTLKSLVTDAGEYASAISRYKDCKVLYIDDLFKPTKDDFGNMRKPTAADVKLAFEIINYRYINQLPTIITSEWYINDLADIDEATASRIAERCGEYQIVVNRDRRKNQRFRNN